MDKKEVLLCYQMITDYLKGDINALKRSDDLGNDVGCGPYLLTASSGIADLGEIFFPDANKDGTRFTSYIKKYLVQVDPVYNRNNADIFIYKHIRCGQVHEAIVKSQVIIGKGKGRDYHLKRLLIDTVSGNSIKAIFFNPRLFADDFLESLKYCERDLEDAILIEKISNFLTERYKSHVESLRNYEPDLEEIIINSDNRDDLYNHTSSARGSPGGVFLKEDFWKLI